MYLTLALRRTVQAIRKHPYLLALLLFLQLLLAGSLFFVIFTYQTQLITEATALLESPANVEQNQATYEPTANNPQALNNQQDILKLYQHYTALIQNLKLLLGWLAGILFIGSGILWLLSHRLLEEGVNAGKFLWRYLLSTIILLLPGVLGSYYSLKVLMVRQTPELLGTTLRDIGMVFLISYYLLLVALALNPARSWKDSIRAWWKTAISVHKTIPLLLINDVIIGGLLALMLWKMWFWLLLPLLILVPLARLFWISGVREIADENSNTSLS
ncbi:MAG: hypothetical protein AABX13_03620 [Nanoarchaeota archaeon]